MYKMTHYITHVFFLLLEYRHKKFCTLVKYCNDFNLEKRCENRYSNFIYNAHSSSLSNHGDLSMVQSKTCKMIISHSYLYMDTSCLLTINFFCQTKWIPSHQLLVRVINFFHTFLLQKSYEALPVYLLNLIVFFSVNYNCKKK